MSSLEEKIGLLERSGYKFVFDRDIYCNRLDRKCFSFEFVKDNPIKTIEKNLKHRTKQHGIDFYFNKRPSGTVRVQLEKVLIGISKKSA